VPAVARDSVVTDACVGDSGPFVSETSQSQTLSTSMCTISSRRQASTPRTGSAIYVTVANWVLLCGCVISLPFCHNSRVWRTDIFLIARLRLHIEICRLLSGGLKIPSRRLGLQVCSAGALGLTVRNLRGKLPSCYRNHDCCCAVS